MIFLFTLFCNPGILYFLTLLPSFLRVLVIFEQYSGKVKAMFINIIFQSLVRKTYVQGILTKIIYKELTWLSFSRSVVSDSLPLHELQHTSLPCPSPSPGLCSNSCPLSLYNHLILCHPLLLLPSIFPSIRVFSNESVLHIR